MICSPKNTRQKGFHRLEKSGPSYLIGRRTAGELVKNFGTPLYAYDGDDLENELACITHILKSPKIRLLYAVKANANIEIIRRCLRHKMGVDLCSPGDVASARAAGADPSVMSYTGVALSRDDMAALVKSGAHINLDSLDEVHLFAKSFCNEKVGLRVQPNIKAGFNEKHYSGMEGGKFGMSAAWAGQAVEILKTSSNRVNVLHCHLGSSINEPTPYLQALEHHLSLANEITSIERVNLGGGIAPLFHPDDEPFPLARLRDGIETRLDAFKARTGRKIAAELELGELVVSQCGYLLAEVQVVKDCPAEGGKRVAITDGGMNLYPAHAHYGSLIHVYVDGKTSSAQDGCWDIYGNTNFSGDRMATGCRLPDLSSGDILIFRNAGAYAYTRSTRFNERPRPAEVLVEGGKAQIIRAAETIDDLLGKQYAGNNE